LALRTLGDDFVEAVNTAWGKEAARDLSKVTMFRRVHLDDRAHSTKRIALFPSMQLPII